MIQNKSVIKDQFILISFVLDQLNCSLDMACDAILVLLKI